VKFQPWEREAWDAKVAEVRARLERSLAEQAAVWRQAEALLAEAERRERRKPVDAM